MNKSIVRLISVFTLLSCLTIQKLVAQKAFVRSEIEAKMIKALEWQEAHPIIAIAPTDWTNGAYYTGVARAHKTTKDQMYMAVLKNQGYWNDWQTFKIKSP